MGVLGWSHVVPGKSIHGTVASTSWNASGLWGATGGLGVGDGDWSILLKPDDPHVLVNHNGKANDNGLIECEVQPGDNTQSAYQYYFQGLYGVSCTVTGYFCEDNSHANKTEIHSVTSIATDLLHGEGWENSIMVLVYSDASSIGALKPQLPPGAGQSVGYQPLAAFPPSPYEPPVNPPSFSVQKFADLNVAHEQFGIVSLPTGPHLNGTIVVHPGGVYAAKISLQWPLNVMKTECQPSSLPLDQRVSLTVTASDVKTGSPINGASVMFGPTEVGKTGQPFQYTFKSQLKTIVVKDSAGKPHQITVKTGPEIAALVRQPRYSDAPIYFQYKT